MEPVEISVVVVFRWQDNARQSWAKPNHKVLINVSMDSTLREVIDKATNDIPHEWAPYAYVAEIIFM